MEFFKRIKRIVVCSILIIIGIVFLFLFYSNYPVKKQNNSAKLGVTFSHRYAADIGLDWRKAYIAILDDLKIRRMRLPVYWDLVEKEEGFFDFSDVDWQLEEARKRDIEVILAIGQKVPRWPECAIPEWTKNIDEKREDALLKLIEKIVDRYKNNLEIKYWQVENEPFLRFGVCPKPDSKLLDKEISLVRKINPKRKIITTDGGEFGLWIPVAKRGDIFGTTLYRNIYKEGVGYYVYPVGPRFFHLKYFLIDHFAKQKNAVVIELQAEPWIKGWTVAAPLEEQFKSMNERKLLENVKYAKEVGFGEIYLWGAEWWYWLKAERNYPAVWEAAKILFQEENENK